METLINGALLVIGLIGLMAVAVFLGFRGLLRQYGSSMQSGADMMTRSQQRIEASLRLQQQTVALLEAILDEQRRMRQAITDPGSPPPFA